MISDNNFTIIIIFSRDNTLYYIFKRGTASIYNLQV